MYIKTLVKKRSNEHRNINDKFYQSREYKAWRKEVIKKSNGMCVHCLDPEIVNENGRTGRILRSGKFTDHIQPIKKGGAKLDPKNGQYLCPYHNHKKTATDR